MGISAKAACLTNSKDVFDITQNIVKAIDEKITQARPDKRRFAKDPNNKFTTIEMSNFSKMITLHFTLNGEARMMSLHFDCHDDAIELGKCKKVFATLGCWGASDELILLAARVLADYGEVYTVFNDCSQSYVKQNFEIVA